VRKIPEDAFEYYVALGPTRSHQAVAQRYGVSKRAVSKCAVREEWSQRLAQIEKSSRDRSDERIGSALDEMRERHLKTLRAMNVRALAALKEYPLESGMEAMRAAEMVIKLERLVTGEATDRTALEGVEREIVLVEVTGDRRHPQLPEEVLELDRLEAAAEKDRAARRNGG
jgi:hypothetical protein